MGAVMIASIEKKSKPVGFLVDDANSPPMPIQERALHSLDRRHKKIVIFGRPGGGKSTFALKLHRLTKIPIYHLDRHFFEANWKERDYRQFLNDQRWMVDSSSWIIDGNSLRSLEMRYRRADLVLYFNLPRFICYWRIFKRLYKKDPDIEDRADGCNETIRLSLVRYMWRFQKRVEKQLTELREKYPQVEFIEVRSDRSLAGLTERVLRACAPSH